MGFNEEDVKELKKQLMEQIGHLPEVQKKEAIDQINGMSPEAIEAMVEQQKSRQQVYRLIVNGEIPAVVVKENEKAIAVMEIYPLSNGHVIVIPKDQVKSKKKIPTEIVSFATELAAKIKDNLSAKDVRLSAEEKFGEAIFEIIPIYEDSKPGAQGKKAEREELEKTAKTINTDVIRKEKKVEVIKKEEKKEVQKEEILKLRRRVP
ncbi:MAG: HIT domain-containing protein [Nanoarchaeota archaeon]|nr:HIT domain-containing protein [Nanoarchaeota archaeon]